MEARQTEFALAVPVCAWCKPRDSGAAPALLSHGICPRHLRKLKRDLHPASGTAPRRSSFRRGHRQSETEAERETEFVLLPG